MKFLLFFLIAAGTFIDSAQACSLAQAPKVARIIKMLAKTDITSTAWSGYRPSEIPSFFVDFSANANCVFVVKDGALLGTREFSEALPLSDSGGHDFIANPQVYPGYPGLSARSIAMASLMSEDGRARVCDAMGTAACELLVPLLGEFNLPYAMVFWLDKDAYGFLESDYGLGLKFSVLIHEMFHFFYQNQGFTKQPWPQTEVPTKISFSDYPAVCHTRDENLMYVSQQETLALRDAFEARHDRAQMLAHVRRFITLRKGRWEAAGPLPRKIRNGSILEDCHDLDGYHEFTEGTAQFVGDYLSVKVGLVAEEQYAETLKRNLETTAESSSKNTLNYFLGSAQLFLLEKITGKGFPASIKKLTENTSGRTVTDALEEALPPGA